MSKHFGHLDDWQKSGGNCCPNCGSANITIGTPQWETAAVFFKNSCHDCHIEYTEDYKLYSTSDRRGNSTYYEDYS